uniref:Uncharacterized protein n=1 Tax=Panagrellus redivivus TaxID=6233 RepID=A0A7E4UQ80_PANRE
MKTLRNRSSFLNKGAIVMTNCGTFRPPTTTLRTTASDGNPVRHSLLNLVEEEDIPELLQAMAEECHFVFDDCDDNRPTTSGIIHAPAKRIERRKARNVNRIRFEEVPPSVFAYVDENTAYEEGEWSDGCRISYDEYRNIVDAAADEAAQQQMDLANWRLAMEQKYAAEAEQREATGAMIAQVVPPRASDAELGVTSTFSYTAPPTTPPPASVASMMGLRPAATS